MRKVTKTCREKHFCLDLRPLHTLSQASFLAQAISAIGSSNVSWLSKIPVLLQGCLLQCPAGERFLVEGLGFHGVCCSSGRRGALFCPWCLLPTSFGLWQLLAALLQHGDLAPLPPTIPEGLFKERNHTPSWRTWGQKHSPKVPLPRVLLLLYEELAQILLLSSLWGSREL